MGAHLGELSAATPMEHVARLRLHRDQQADQTLRLTLLGEEPFVAKLWPKDFLAETLLGRNPPWPKPSLAENRVG